jgi:phage terminase large subunit-like protein
MHEEAAHLSPEELERADALIAQLSGGFAANRLKLYKPYEWQREFHEAGAIKSERMLMAGNRTGKTLCAAAEVTFHLTGDYPDWWKGRRFSQPTLVWTGSPTNETSRDIVQAELLGGPGEKLGTGWIPRERIVGKPSARQCGVKNVFESVQVRHKSGGISSVNFKTYDQGWAKFQGTAPHVVWLDEEPEDYMIFSECQTRILTVRGIVLVTFTPLRGVTELVEHFQKGLSGTFIKGATWDDAPHLAEKDKAELLSRYRVHERKTRSEGIPMMGEGAVFPIDDEHLMVDAFPIPRHFARIKGCDFGLDHPAAGVDIAYDRDRDIVYVIDCYKKEGELAPYHAAWFNKSDKWVPVSWPHDGLNREKKGGSTIADGYRAHGVNMLTKSARYRRVKGEDTEKGGPQPVWPIIDHVRERMQTGRFKVFRHLSQWFEEKRSYYVKDQKLSTTRDDILKATFYAVMMLRYAATPSAARPSSNSVPVATVRL